MVCHFWFMIFPPFLTHDTGTSHLLPPQNKSPRIPKELHPQLVIFKFLDGFLLGINAKHLNTIKFCRDENYWIANSLASSHVAKLVQKSWFQVAFCLPCFSSLQHFSFICSQIPLTSFLQNTCNIHYSKLTNSSMNWKVPRTKLRLNKKINIYFHF